MDGCYENGTAEQKAKVVMRLFDAITDRDWSEYERSKKRRSDYIAESIKQHGEYYLDVFQVTYPSQITDISGILFRKDDGTGSKMKESIVYIAKQLREIKKERSKTERDKKFSLVCDAIENHLAGDECIGDLVGQVDMIVSSGPYGLQKFFLHNYSIALAKELLQNHKEKIVETASKGIAESSFNDSTVEESRQKFTIDAEYQEVHITL